MERQFKIIFLGILILFCIIILITVFKHKCKPHCSGLVCGENSDDGCGNNCSCNKGGKCLNGKCIYGTCNGLSCGSDGLGGICDCNALPNGICVDNSKCSTNTNCNIICSEDKCLTNSCICIDKKICCYSQDHDGYYCGPDGCGGTAECLPGSTCSQTNIPGICYNSGSLGWRYNILSSRGISRSNVSSPEECSKWIPKNLFLDLQNFPCEIDKDCPEGEQCINGYCDKNNIFQYWYYDPTDLSGYNCTKAVAGSSVCGIKKEGCSGFDVIGNKSPEEIECGTTCTINPLCSESGIGSCCPQDWINNNSSYCKDYSQKIMCCLNNPDYKDYNICINSGYPSCEKINAWRKGNIGEIQNGICGISLSGQNISINKNILESKNSYFKSPCIGKYSSDSCLYNDGITSYTGLCQVSIDGEQRCLPETICMATYNSSDQPGSCRSPNF